MHKALQRQLKRLLGIEDASALAQMLGETNASHGALTPELAHLLRELPAFLQRVEETYEQHDRDLELRSRSLELSSSELTALNTRLREDLNTQERAVTTLQNMVREMVPGLPCNLESSGNLESLTRLLSELMRQRELGRRELDNQQFALDQHAIVSITDVSGRIRYANDKFCEISGYSLQEIMGRDHRLVKSGFHDAAFFTRMWETIASGQVWQGEICNRAKDGSLYWVAATIVPSLDEQGLPYQYIAIRTDISNRKAAEASLQATEAEMRQAKEAAEAASRAKSEFLANMSHEIRTPMNGIIGMTELALDTPLNDEQREYLQIVKSSSESLLTIINDILDFSKIEAGKLHIDTTSFSLGRLVAETLRTLSMRAYQKGLEVVVEMDPALPKQVTGDPGRIRQILVNLIGNAIKFTQRGEIVVRVAVQGQSQDVLDLLFSVRDTGIGIPPEKQAMIFDAFAQEDASITRTYGGTGLGLSISRRLVELMGGRMWLESQLGQGSTFSFSLQLPVVVEEVLAAPSPEPVVDLQTSSEGLNILLAEDNPINQKLALSLLDKWGHQATLAENGEEAVSLAISQPFDLILMDMQMPLMGGVEATRIIREREQALNLPRVPIVAMTANAMEGDRAACLAAGMDDHIAKPIQVQALFERLQALQGMPEVHGEAHVHDYGRALAEADQEIVGIVAGLFLEAVDDELARMRHALADADWTSLQRTAHTLKGNLGHFNALPAQRLAGEVEHQLARGDTKGLAGKLDVLEQEINYLRPHLQVYAE